VLSFSYVGSEASSPAGDLFRQPPATRLLPDVEPIQRRGSRNADLRTFWGKLTFTRRFRADDKRHARPSRGKFCQRRLRCQHWQLELQFISSRRPPLRTSASISPRDIHSASPSTRHRAFRHHQSVQFQRDARALSLGFETQPGLHLLVPTSTRTSHLPREILGRRAGPFRGSPGLAPVSP